MAEGKSVGGLVSVASRYGVEESLARLLELLRSKGITVFAVVDHSGEAAKVGMTMPATKLVIFGNPRSGTPLMLAAPSTAIDLPLKVLIREEEGGTVMSYNSAEYLGERHGLPEEMRAVLAGVAGLLEAVGR